MTLFLTFDLEESYHAQNLRTLYPPSSWSGLPQKAASVTRCLVDKLNALNVRATFFVLASWADKNKDLVKFIHETGHEVASHGYSHIKPALLSDKEFRDEAIQSKNILEQMTGSGIYGYRAPCFSILDRHLDILAEAGYTYDSSWHPCSLNKNYGVLSRFKDLDASLLHAGGVREYALPVLKIYNTSLPVGGGAYFRFMPLVFYKLLADFYIRKYKSMVFYSHPWELFYDDIDLSSLSLPRRIRQRFNTKNGLSRTLNWIESNIKSKVDFKSIRDSL